MSNGGITRFDESESRSAVVSSSLALDCVPWFHVKSSNCLFFTRPHLFGLLMEKLLNRGPCCWSKVARARVERTRASCSGLEWHPHAYSSTHGQGRSYIMPVLVEPGRLLAALAHLPEAMGPAAKWLPALGGVRWTREAWVEGTSSSSRSLGIWCMSGDGFARSNRCGLTTLEIQFP